MLEQMDKQVAKLRKELLTMCWYMRGGLTYEESVFLSQVDRQAIAEIIESNLKTTKDSHLPFF
jgi:hypothetical protein